LAEAATTRSESREILQDMVGRLNQSHFGIIPEEAQRAGSADDPADEDAPVESATSADGEIGVSLRVVDGRAVVTRVRSDGPAAEAGVRPGWIISRIGRTKVDERVAALSDALADHTAKLYAWQALTARLGGEPGTDIEVAFLDADDRQVIHTLTRIRTEGQVVRFGNLPPVSVVVESRWLSPQETGSADARIGYIAFNLFMIPVTPDFERAMIEFKDADAVIVDLRGNLGGVAAMGASLSRFFVAERSRIGTMMMRGQDLQFNAEPIVVASSGERLRPFAGPVAVLIDEISASTSEFMAGGLRGLGRARTFGTRTAGMALPAGMTSLPSGDVLLHAIADWTSSDGSRLEADGVPADTVVPVRRQDLLEGRDAALRAAASWLAGQANGAS
jgi:carboxyl-terminal processing protease